jgi:protein-S-isoprenylcysteine O-methyltransferase Ste14
MYAKQKKSYSNTILDVRRIVRKGLTKLNLFQIITLALLCVFYIAYYAKAFMLKRHGISVNLLGKGDKPQAARTAEYFLRIATFAGAAAQFVSVLLPLIIRPLPLPMPFRIAGVFVMGLGNLFFIAAVITMRNNWRACFNRSQNTNLVTSGIYSVSRNPAFVGFDLLYLGCAAAFPNMANITAAVIAITLFHIQILGEEKYCAEFFGYEYTAYKAKVMRYIGRKQ